MLSAFADDQVCRTEVEQLSTLGKFDGVSNDILKRANISYLQEKNSDFCHRNMLMRYLDTKGSLPKGVESLSTDQLEALVDKKDTESGPWQLSLVSTDKSKLKATLAALNPLGLQSEHDPIKVFSKAIKKDPSFYTKINAELGRLTKNRNVAKATNHPLLQVAACASEFVLSIGYCMQAVNLIKEKMTPRGLGTDITDIELWKRVLGSGKYDEGLRLTALSMAKQIKNGSYNNTSNIFNDLKENFKKSGLSNTDASNAAWDTLGIIGNHGPNIGAYTKEMEILSIIGDSLNNTTADQIRGSKLCTKKPEALAYIAAAMTYLDSQKLKNRQAMYSYPPNVHTSCDNSKPYHFWMSAYLARSLVMEGHLSSWVSAKSTFLAEKAYQVSRNQASSAQAGQLSNLFFEHLYSPAHQIVRTDLAYSAAGSQFGAEAANSHASRVYDVDARVLALEKNAGNTTFEPGEIKRMTNIESYLKWFSIFQPDSAFNEIAKKGKN